MRPAAVGPSVVLSRRREPARAAPRVPSIHAIDIRARVIVTDPDAFAVTLEHGIGTAKAYGYGMIRAQQLSQ